MYAKPLIKTIFWCFMICFLSACKSGTNNPSKTITKWSGKTMGTSYHITFIGGNEPQQARIDLLLKDINQAVSTYIPQSLVSQFNQSSKGLSISNPQSQTVESTEKMSIDYHFYKNVATAASLFTETDRYFDPSCMPLVNYWGFGYTPKKAITQVDSAKIKEILTFVGFEKLQIQSNKDSIHYLKSQPDFELDFSASAKGYAVDILLQYLMEKQVKHALVEIGGETRTIGNNPQGLAWKIGINTPDPNAQFNDFEYIVPMQNKALASSGNYRNFYEVNGQKYGHEISPINGYPSQNELLSVSIIADHCSMADAYATAAMVMGLEKAKKLVEAHDHIEGLFIIGDADGNYELIKTSNFP